MAIEVTEKIKKLMEKGVRIPNPLSVEKQRLRTGGNK
jgi:hypothetical protein